MDAVLEIFFKAFSVAYRPNLNVPKVSKNGFWSHFSNLTQNAFGSSKKKLFARPLSRFEITSVTITEAMGTGTQLKKEEKKRINI